MSHNYLSGGFFYGHFQNCQIFVRQHQGLLRRNWHFSVLWQHHTVLIDSCDVAVQGTGLQSKQHQNHRRGMSLKEPRVWSLKATQEEDGDKQSLAENLGIPQSSRKSAPGDAFPLPGKSHTSQARGPQQESNSTLLHRRSHHCAAAKEMHCLPDLWMMQVWHCCSNAAQGKPRSQPVNKPEFGKSQWRAVLPNSWPAGGHGRQAAGPELTVAAQALPVLPQLRTTLI